jgi:hypothetical protein
LLGLLRTVRGVSASSSSYLEKEPAEDPARIGSAEADAPLVDEIEIVVVMTGPAAPEVRSPLDEVY